MAKASWAANQLAIGVRNVLACNHFWVDSATTTGCRTMTTKYASG